MSWVHKDENCIPLTKSFRLTVISVNDKTATNVCISRNLILLEFLFMSKKKWKLSIRFNISGFYYNLKILKNYRTVFLISVLAFKVQTFK